MFTLIELASLHLWSGLLTSSVCIFDTLFVPIRCNAYATIQLFIMISLIFRITHSADERNKVYCFMCGTKGFCGFLVIVVVAAKVLLSISFQLYSSHFHSLSSDFRWTSMRCKEFHTLYELRDIKLYKFDNDHTFSRVQHIPKIMKNRSIVFFLSCCFFVLLLYLSIDSRIVYINSNNFISQSV